MGLKPTDKGEFTDENENAFFCSDRSISRVTAKLTNEFRTRITTMALAG